MQTLQLLYKSDFYELEADMEDGIIRANWLRSVVKSEMVAGGTKLHDVLLETGLTKVITNAQNLKSLDADTKEWMSAELYRLLSQTGLEKIARVLPTNLFYQIALESVVTRAEALGVVKFQYKNFSDNQVALEWLKH